jgi:DNA-binding MarR family transcriptional regulator
MIAALDDFRSRVHKDMPVQHVVLLLAVAETPGITMTELIRALDMSQGAVSRNVKLLSLFIERVGGTAVARGAGLLRTEPVGEGRSLAVYLTEKGEDLVREVVGAVRPVFLDPPHRPGVRFPAVKSKAISAGVG